ncbi:M24 family metallopeptidase [Nosocomiicoccus ampullae]|uniref:Xaa-Pro aminopeptidase n=1 Tax=Nosocomiicoccus ampullae TaxID=489910 RepID=A0A9Q2D0Y4_9STAP|nr:aminopeptidase P family protein [Nosocomiicoccus ampullae]MBB5176414.1 Xaa-Pro aminopeptidase [Nosocomiicoccus ampullae]QYA47606.1 aminopeptidase P family protein [Nosocomiicoccus ampullae]QYA49236.1 aminopeptidase P family protein [Nosocomiicoccus ampullae]
MKKLDNTKSLLKKYDVDAILIMSEFNRRYLSDFTGSSGAVIITNDDEYLISDFRYNVQAREESPHFEFVLQNKGLLPFIIEFLKSKDIKKLGFEGEYTNYNDYSKLESEFDLEAITGEFEKMRMIKSEDEIAHIQKACEIVDKAYEHILTFVKAGMTELEVKAELEYKMAQLGSEGPSFDTIVASGYRGALPHATPSEKVIEDGDLVTLDFGATYNGYVSDITRTFGVGNVSDELKNVYNIVLESQLKSLETIKVGFTGKEADKVARDIITENGYGDNFGHSLGHGIGLEVHEGPGLAKTVDTVLEENMIITIEPGIYVEDLGGVRIEDDAIVTTEGLKKLTHSSKELFIINN